MGCACNTQVGEETWMYCGGNLERKVHCGDLSVDWRIILMLTLKEQDVRAWTGLSWLSIESDDMFF
jgi:hypothetical protein